jgi:ABC-2 type transport system ATP-binding protein
MNNTIAAAGLTKTYRGGVRALDGLTIAVETGTIFALLGPNGAGKSTTVKILTTLSRPDGGSAQVAGFDVLARPDQVRRCIGVVAQRSGVDSQITGRENLTLQGQLYGLRGADLRGRTAALLDRFGLTESADRLAGGYSGGMQRRLDIAMGLIHRPQVLFLDEPTTGLDPEIRAQMWDAISRLATEEGLTILLTTHYLEEADKLAARLAIVDKGRVVVEGTAERLKSELHGDALRIELAASPQRDRIDAALNRLDGVRDVTLSDHTLHARADNGAAAVPLLLQSLQARGIAVASVTVATPSLDDVYLRHTGRTFEQADRETDHRIRQGGRS